MARICASGEAIGMRSRTDHGCDAQAGGKTSGSSRGVVQSIDGDVVRQAGGRITNGHWVVWLSAGVDSSTAEEISAVTQT